MKKRPFLVSAIFVTFFLLIQSNTPAKIVYVDKSAAGDGSGSSWENACLTITTGLDASTSGDEIWVKAATYNEAITMKEGVALYGGFPADGSPAFDDRDWVNYETIIDATGLGTHVIKIDDIEETTIDGLTITGGKAGYGGGVHCEYSFSPTLTNCIIIGNDAYYGGSGVYCGNSFPTLINCIIIGNTSGWSSGSIFCRGSSPILTNCTITGNRTGYSSRSSGLYLIDSSFPVLTNCILWNQEHELLCDSTSQVVVKYSCIQGGWPGEGNIRRYPLFVDPVNRDYRLQDGSSCIDQGRSEEAPNIDIVGNPRPGGDSLVDIGAYESPDEYTPGPTYEILHVRADAEPGGDGKSWQDAFPLIGQAIAAAPEGQVIWVAAGRYRETIEMTSKIFLLGGFDGTETNWDERANRFSETIIDASGFNESAVIGASWSELNGFTIMNGLASEYGGGIYCLSQSPLIRNCIITKCRAEYGAGVYLSQCAPVFVNCAIIKNAAGWSPGAVRSYQSRPYFYNCTIADNIGNNELGPEVGGIGVVENSHLTLMGCILSNYNTEINITPNSSASVSHSAVPSRWHGVGNIYSDPLFASPSTGDYRLRPGSPCIDCNETSYDLSFPLDLDGHYRIWDGNDDGAARIDMGAYEFGSIKPLAGDTNGDETVDESDPFFFSRWWHQPANLNNFLCDVVADATIDEQDLMELLQYWK